MKKAMKRTVALLILVCLTAAMIPAVFAGEASALTYNFGNHGAGHGNALDKNDTIADTFERTDGTWRYNSGWTKGALLAYGKDEQVGSGITMNFGSNGGVNWEWRWIALEIKTPAAGEYVVSMEAITAADGCQADVFILPKEGTTLNQTNNPELFVDANKLGTVDCTAGAAAVQTIGTWTVPENAADTCLLVFRHGGGAKQYARISAMNLTPVEKETAVATSKLGDVTTEYATADALAKAINGAVSDTTFTLLADELTTEIEIELPEGVTLDLNGKTLTATVDATQGTVTDATDGAGSIVGSSAVVKTGANEVAIKSGNTYKIFDYTMNVEETAEEKDNGSVSFWFKVALSDAALGLIDDGTTDFAVGATMQWTADGASSSKNVALEAAEVTKWAGLMQEEDYWFYLNVTGFDTLGDVAGTLTVTPTISGNAGTPINYSVN